MCSTETNKNRCTTYRRIVRRFKRLWNNYVLPNGLACTCSTRQDWEKMYITYVKQRILYFERMGHKAPTICRFLRKEGVKTSRVGIHKFLQKYRETKSIVRRPGSGRRPNPAASNLRRIVYLCTHPPNRSRIIAQYLSFRFSTVLRSVQRKPFLRSTVVSITLYCCLL